MMTIYGKKVQIAPPHPKMRVSPAFARIQDPDLVERTNAWMAEFFGYVETVPDGQVISLVQQDVLFMNQRTYDQLREALQNR